MIVSIITLSQRYIYKNHTFAQIIVGFIIGSSIGYCFYKLSTDIIVGKLVCKKDDNCLVDNNL